LLARVVIEGDVFAVASRAAEERARKTKALSVHPFDHAQVICGQGTLAMELEAQVPDLDTVLVAVGGGGFIGGSRPGTTSGCALSE
jgi:threonine dehydratase